MSLARKLEIQLDSTREQLENALSQNTELSFKAQRNDDFAKKLEMTNYTCGRKLTA